MNAILRAFLFISICVFHNADADSAERGQPLLLTPLIKAGKLEEARAAARDNIRDLHSHIEQELQSFSGYLTVEDEKKSNLFFWFFPAEAKPESAPVLLVLKDYAGATTLKWLLAETGPFVIIDDKSELELRPTRWTRICSMLFIDVPAGSGYSFPTNKNIAKPSTFAEEQEEIYDALTQFFTLFPEFQQQEFYLTGTKDAAVTAPYLIKRIEEGNSVSKIKINIKGGIIGSPWLKLDAIFADDFMLKLGLINSDQYEELHATYRRAFEAVDTYDFKTFIDNMLLSERQQKNYTGFIKHENALESNASIDNLQKYLNSKDLHQYLHVGEQEFVSVYIQDNKYSQPESFANHMTAFGQMLDKGYKFLVYVPQFDLLAAPDVTLKMIMDIKWGRQAELASAQRKVWKVDSDVAGYAKQAGNFNLILLRNAGYRACADQPEWTFEMMRKFMADESFEFK